MNDLSFTQCCEDVPRLTPTVFLILAAPVFTSRSKNVNYCNVQYCTLYSVHGIWYLQYFTKYM